MVLFSHGQAWAWVGLELNAKATGIEDRYGITGSDRYGSLWEFSGRLLYQESLGRIDTEIQGLVQYARSTGGVNIPLQTAESPFRSLDLQTTHTSDNHSILYSELDRLTLSWRAPGLTFTLGRQAISWGEAFFYNIGDIFGAFPVTETNRRYKPGIDAVNAEVNLGPFSKLSMIAVPDNDSPDNLAAHVDFPLGPGTFSLTGGRVLENDRAGAGYTADISGTQVYGSLLFTRTADGEGYSQAVVGGERQLGPYTLVLGELYRNGPGADDPDDYPALILSEEYLSGNLFTLGRYNMAISVSAQVSPLVTLTPALFANLSDGSNLIRMDGSYSISDYTDMTGGFFIGLGKRPEDGIPRSEYGSIPVSIYVEVVHNI